MGSEGFVCPLVDVLESVSCDVQFLTSTSNLLRIFLLTMVLFVAVLFQFLALSSEAFTTHSSASAFSQRGRSHLGMKEQELIIGTGIEQVAKDHDIFLLDMWGVMHDGSRTYEGVIETVKKLKEAGKEMIILSNSSKRQSNSLQMLEKLGFDPLNDFSQVITSGDVSVVIQESGTLFAIATYLTLLWNSTTFADFASNVGR